MPNCYINSSMAYTFFPEKKADIIKQLKNQPEKVADIIELFDFLKKKYDSIKTPINIDKAKLNVINVTRELQGSIDIKDIQRAINNAYQKGINDLKAQYQRELDRHLNAKYNEGYLDGQRNAYAEDDMRKQYQKGYAAGQKSKAIQKSEPSDIVQNSENTRSIVGNIHGSSTAQIYFHNQSTGTIHIVQS